MANTNKMKTEVMVGALVIVVLIAVFFALQAPPEAPEQPEAAEEPVEEAPVVEEEAPVAPEEPEPEPEEIPAEEPEPEPEPEAVKILSGLKCAGDNVEGTIINVLDTQLLVEDVRVLFNGNVIVPASLRCDKTVLQPGESTLCASLQGVLPALGENQIAIVIGEESIQETIEC